MNNNQGALFTSVEDFDDYITDMVEPLSTIEIVELIEVLPEWADAKNESAESAVEVARALEAFVAARIDTTPEELREGAREYYISSGAFYSKEMWHRYIEYLRMAVGVQEEAAGILEHAASTPAPATTEHVASTEWTPGAIAVSSWGYEQTNVDFYEVTRVTASSVWLRPIAKESVENTEMMTSRVTPRPGVFTGSEFRKKRPEGDWMRLDSFSSASLWDGKPARASHYA